MYKVIRLRWGSRIILTCQFWELTAQHVLSPRLWHFSATTHWINHNAFRWGDSLCGGVEKGDPGMEQYIPAVKKIWAHIALLLCRGAKQPRRPHRGLWVVKVIMRGWKENKSAMKRRWRRRKELLKGFPASEGLPAPHRFSINTQHRVFHHQSIIV